MTTAAHSPTNSLIQLTGWFKSPATGRSEENCSLVVPTYERPCQIVDLVECLHRLPDPPDEVIVVDGGPGRESEKALQACVMGRDLRFKLIYVRGPQGLTRQRNAGIDVSKGDLVFFLDDDCTPEPGYFRAIHSVFMCHEERDRVGAVCGTDSNLICRRTRLPTRWRVRFALRLVDGRNPCRFYPSAITVPRQLDASFAGTREVDYVTGAAMAFRRAVFAKHRFSSFFEGYSQGEDLEMSLRVGRDWKLLWCGDARVEHHIAPGGRPKPFERGIMEVRNRYFIWRRHVPEPTLRARSQFWTDTFLSFLYPLGGFALHPSQTWHLNYARGVLTGICGCLLNPPAYREPQARQQYYCQPLELADHNRTSRR